MIKIMGQKIAIDWRNFQPGTSFFLPCINRMRTERDIKKEVIRLKIDNIVSKQVVENGIYGLRVWRTSNTIDPHSTHSLLDS